jgi:hemerythrin
MNIPWHDQSKTGSFEIDAEHQELFNQINRFLAATDVASLTFCTMSMFNCTHEHFKHEENVMNQMAYPERIEHVIQHNDLLSRFIGMAECITKGTLNKSDLESFLSNWLWNHIETSDAKLAAYVKLHK